MPELTDEEVAQLRADAARAGELETELASTRETAAQQLREAVVAGRPDLPGELIVGSTAEELAASVGRADALVAGIRDRTLEEVRGLAAGRAPMGFRPGGGGPRERPGPPEGLVGVARMKWALENEEAK